MKFSSILNPRDWGVCIALVALTLLPLSSRGQATARPSAATQSGSSAAAETGIASYYGHPYHGRTTASGEVFDMNALTAAHPKLAFGTRVRVTHLDNQRSVVVRINDRGPFIAGRVIDLSKAAAAELQMIQSGLARVKVEVLN